MLPGPDDGDLDAALVLDHHLAVGDHRELLGGGAALDQHGVGGQPHGGQQRTDPRQLVSVAAGEQRQVGDIRDEDQPTPLHGPGLSTVLRNQPF